VLVSCDLPCIEVWRRAEDGTWAARTAARRRQAELTSIACTLSVDEVYDAAAEPGDG
jgi:hypothetical protein